jgi:endonuclease-3 related protein
LSLPSPSPPTHLYDRLCSAFGAQRWWPAKTSFEVIVGAILTQNTAWRYVERAIANLRKSERSRRERSTNYPNPNWWN